MEILHLPCSCRYCQANIPQLNSLSTVNSTIAPSLLSLPCSARLGCQCSSNLVPSWRLFHISLLAFSSQADFQLTSELSHSPTTSLHSTELHSVKVKVRVKVTLRLAVYRQSVHLGVKPLESHDHRFFFHWTLKVTVLMEHPLWREDGFVSYEYAWPYVNCTFRTYNMSKSKSHCDWRSISQSVSKSWCRSPSGAHDQIFITTWQLRSCFCRTPSLTRGRVCRSYMLLALASAVFLGFESLGTRDHVLLSQILDFPFRRLLRLAGSRWWY
jgi:hypothetical protein